MNSTSSGFRLERETGREGDREEGKEGRGREGGKEGKGGERETKVKGDIRSRMSINYTQQTKCVAPF